MAGSRTADLAAKRRLGKRDVLRAILQREVMGLPLNHTAVMRTDGRLQRAALRLYGQWDDALKAAGVDPRRVRCKRKWSRQEVIRRIRELARQGRELNSAAVQAYESVLVSAAYRFFPSWDAALSGAGMVPQRWRKMRPPWTRNGVIRTIRRIDKDGGKLNRAAVTDPSLPSAAIRLFGSWDAALEAAGLDPGQIRRYRTPWTKETVIRVIRRKRRAGEGLAYSQATPSSLVPAATRLFGSWNAAMVAAGLDPARVRLYKTHCKPWTPQSILAEIRRRHRAHEPLNMQHVSPYSLYVSGSRFFGSWDDALTAAGLDPSKIRKRPPFGSRVRKP